MGFRIETDERPAKGLVRIYDEQLEKLRADLERLRSQPDGVELHYVEMVRHARVRCKRIRAVLRLARRHLSSKQYRSLNKWWRDAARGLSDTRDFAARVEALDAVRADPGGQIHEELGARLRAWFALYSVGQLGKSLAKESLMSFRSIASHAPRLVLEGDRNAEDFIRSYQRSYLRARGAMDEAIEGDDPNLFHEWRKRVKSMGLQARLLRALFPELEAHVQAGRQLSRVLGVAQNIDVVVETIERDSSLPVTAVEAAGMKSLMKKRRDELFDEALKLAAELLPDADVSLTSRAEAKI